MRNKSKTTIKNFAVSSLAVLLASVFIFTGCSKKESSGSGSSSHKPIIFTKWDTAKHAIAILPADTIRQLLITEAEPSSKGLFTSPAYAQNGDLYANVAIYCYGPTVGTLPTNALHIRIYNAPGPVGTAFAPTPSAPVNALPSPKPTPSIPTGLESYTTYTYYDNPMLFAPPPAMDIDSRNGNLATNPRPAKQSEFATRVHLISPGNMMGYIEPWSLTTSPSPFLNPNATGVGHYNYGPEPAAAFVTDPKLNTPKMVNYWRIKDASGNEVRVVVTLEEP